MKKYAYKFVEVSRKSGMKDKIGYTFEECKQVILAEQGWRLKQIVTPFNEKTGLSVLLCYQIIFEREI